MLYVYHLSNGNSVIVHVQESVHVFGKLFLFTSTAIAIILLYMYMDVQEFVRAHAFRIYTHSHIIFFVSSCTLHYLMSGFFSVSFRQGIQCSQKPGSVVCWCH